MKIFFLISSSSSSQRVKREREGEERGRKMKTSKEKKMSDGLCVCGDLIMTNGSATDP